MLITFKTTLSMMKKKKLQIVLISLIFVLISTLVYIGLSVMNQTSMFSKMFERANASQDMILFEGVTSMDEYETWWRQHPSVDDFIRYNSIMTEASYEVEGEKISETILLTEYNNDTIDMLYYSDDEYVSEPYGNEIYINTNMAKSKGLMKGNSLKVCLNNQVHTFVIKEIIVDPHFSTPFNSPNRCFISNAYFTENHLVATNTIFGMQYNDNLNNHQGVFDDFQATVGRLSQPYYLGYDTFSMTYNIILSIIGAILLSVSIFIFLIALIIIRSTIRQLILNQYTQIGIKKVLGYTHQQIRNSYLYQFIIMGAFSSVIGVLIGFPIRTLINKDLSYDMQVGIKTSIDLFAFLAPAIVLLVISLTTLRIVNKTKKIEPLQAIKYGMPERSTHYSKFSIVAKNLPLVLLLAFKQIFGNKRKTITTIMTVTLLMYVTFTISNIGYTLGQSSYMAESLLGLEIGEFAIQAPNSDFESFIETVESYDEVDELLFMDINIGGSTYDQDDIMMNASHMTIYGDRSDVVNLSAGRNPKSSSEVIISQVISERTGKNVGDYIVIESETGPHKYLVSGIVRSIMNSSMLYISLEEKLPQQFESEMSGLKFLWGYGENIDLDELDKKVKSDFGSDVNVTRYDANINTILSTLTYFPVVVKTLLFVFVSICGIIYANLTIMDINHDTRVYGIMKAIGFNNFEIVKVLLIKSTIMTSLGLVIGFITCLFTMNGIMQSVFNITPFSSIHMPMLLDIKGSIVLILIFFSTSFIGTLLPTKRITKVSPKQLISE